MTAGRRQLTAFVAYSHKDEGLRYELDAHLAILKRLGIIETWYDGKIPAGGELESSILKTLNTADLILLLISSDFLNSEFCYSVEMTRALERHDAREAVVIPICVRPCHWKGAPFARLRGLPKDMEAVTSSSWASKDEAFADVTREIHWTVELMAGERRPAEISATFEAHPEPNQPAILMSLGLRGTLRKEPVVYVSSEHGLNECRIDSGSSAKLAVNLESLPPTGYAGWDAHIYCPTMLYEQAEMAEEVIWPDSTFPARSAGPAGSISLGAAVGIGVNASYYLGPLLELSLRCPFEKASHAHSHSIYLIAADVVDESLTVTAAASIGRALLAELGNQDIAAVLTVTCQPSPGP